MRCDALRLIYVGRDGILSAFRTAVWPWTASGSNAAYILPVIALLLKTFATFKLDFQILPKIRDFTPSNFIKI